MLDTRSVKQSISRRLISSESADIDLIKYKHISELYYNDYVLFYYLKLNDNGKLIEKFPEYRKTEWTKEEVISESSKYNNYIDFCTCEEFAFEYADYNMFLKELDIHSDKILIRPSWYWTKERILKFAKKYTCEWNFYTDYGTVKQVLEKNKDWKAEINYQSLEDIYTYDKCYEIAKSCKSIKDMYLHHRNAYNIAYKNKWLNDYTWFEYTYDECFEIAKTCKSRTDMYHKNSRAYATAKKYKWFKDYVWFEIMRHIDDFTEEECYEIAKTCNTKKLMMNKSKKAYNTAKENDWIKNYTWFKVRKKVVFTEEHCLIVAKECKSLSEMRNRFREEYNFAKQHNWIKSYDLIDDLIKSELSYDDCFNIAKLCNTKSELYTKSHKAYRAAKENNWFKDYTWFKIQLRPPYTYEQCLELAKQCHTKSEMTYKSSALYKWAKSHDWVKDYTWFDDTSIYEEPIYNVYVYILEEQKKVYVGIVRDWCKKRRFNQHKNLPDVLNLTCKEYGIPIPEPIYLQEHLLPTEAQYYEEYYRVYYRERGYEDINIGKTGIGSSSLGSKAVQWTEERCYEEAKKYEYYSDFVRKSSIAYYRAKVMGYIKDYTWLKRKLIFHRKEDIIESAKKFEYYEDFVVEEPFAYNAAYNMKITDEVHKVLKSKYKGILYKDNPFIEEISNIVALYETIHKFRSKHRNLYNYITEMNCIYFMYKDLNYKNRFSYEKCEEKYMSCISIEEFKEKYPKYYYVCYGNGWIESLENLGK